MNGTGNNVDEIRYRSYLNQMERDQDSQIKEKEEIHQERLASLIASNDQTHQNLRKDYDVKISAEAEMLEQKLAQIRERNQEIVDQEKESGVHEADKVHNQYVAKIELEKKVGDDQIAKLQNYYKGASEKLHHQFEKDRERVESQKGKA